MDSEKQHIRCRTIIEILGKPKEHVENTIKDYVKKIEQDTDLIVMKKEFAEAKEQEKPISADKLWSAFVEIEMVVKGLPKLIGFCFDYMPSSLEIIKPEELVMNNRMIADFLNDLQARLHSLDMIVKQLKNENIFLRKNMNNIFKNIILVSIAQKDLDKATLTKVTGIPEKELEIFLNRLIEDKVIKKEGDFYSLKKDGEAQTQD